MLGVAAGHRMVLQLAEASGKRHVLGAAEVLITQEQHSVRKQQRAQLREQVVVVDRVGQVDPAYLGANRTGQLFDVHAVALFR
ncbi:hypothetical protein D3C71_1906520 [compost metagenome]